MTKPEKTKKHSPKGQLWLRDVDRKKFIKWKETTSSHKPYESFIRTQSTHSLGRKHQLFCKKQNRLVALLSDGELLAYKHLIWTQNVFSVEEQYALNPVETFNIAKQLDIVHPYDFKKAIHHVMTTDFLVTSFNDDGELYRTAYSYKPVFDGKKTSRTYKKLQIEQAFWARKKIPYRVITRCDFGLNEEKDSKAWLASLLFCEIHYDSAIDENALQLFTHNLIMQHQLEPWSPLRNILKSLSNKYRYTQIEAEIFFKNAVLKGFLKIQRAKRIRLNEALNLDLVGGSECFI